MDLSDSELYWTRKKKGLATEKKTEEYIRSLESKLNKEKEKNKELLDKNKIIKILGFDENTSNDTIYRNIEILVSEFERLEDIEDRKVQVEYNFVFNQGVRSIEKKIKEKIEELEKQEDWYIENKSLDELYGNIKMLQELLQEGDDK